MGKALQPPFVRAAVTAVANGQYRGKLQAQRRLVSVYRITGPGMIILGLIGIASTLFFPHKAGFWIPFRLAEYVFFTLVGIVQIVAAVVVDRRVKLQDA